MPDPVRLSEHLDPSWDHGEGDVQVFSRLLHILSIPGAAQRDNLRIQFPDLGNVRLQLTELPAARRSAIRQIED